VETEALFAGCGVELTSGDRAWFERLFEAVLDANRRMNLTRITLRDEFYAKHVLDSILPFVCVPELAALEAPQLVADIGSGAGFPGLVLARLRPDWSIALIERTQKKAAFLDETIEALGLENAYAVPFDAREAPRHADVLAHGCGIVTARAVGRIADVTKTAAGLLRPRGLIVHYKGGTPDPDELADGRKEAQRLGIAQDEPFVYDLPPDARRSVVISRSSGRKHGGRRGRTAK